MALSTEKRIQKEKDFEVVFKKGKTVKGTGILLKYVATPGAQSRFGVVVSAKVSPLATRRNTLKRRISEIIRHLTIKPGYDCVVLMTQSTLSKEELKKEIQGALSRADLLV